LLRAVEAQATVEELVVVLLSTNPSNPNNNAVVSAANLLVVVSDNIYACMLTQQTKLHDIIYDGFSLLMTIKYY
jgi:hypothetical protein